MKPTRDDTAGESQSRIDRILDLGLYAPIGLFSSSGDVVHDLAEQGRKQIAFSRSLGRAALRAVATSRSTAPATVTLTPEPSVEPSDPPIADYPSLTAREIIALIPSCTPEERAGIEAAERAGKARVTVLRALQSD